MISLSDEQIRFLHMRAQSLNAQFPGGKGVAQVVKDVCGIQAQDVGAARLAVRVRSVGLRAVDVEHARVEERSVVRTWGPRGTLHLLATEDLGWLLSLIGPIFIAKDQRRRIALGLDEDVCARGIRSMQKMLGSEGPLTRAEIVEGLAKQGIQLEGQARPHLLGRAALEGVICFGPDRGSEPTYVLLSDWVEGVVRSTSLTEEGALIKFARSYLRAYGPASMEDFAIWSGMPLGEIRRMWRLVVDDLLEVEIAGRSAWMPREHIDRLDEITSATLSARLLPGFDTYLLGYQKRDLLVPLAYAKRVNAGGGIVHPTLLVNGRVMGIWRMKRRTNVVDVLVEPFETVEKEVALDLEREVEDIGRFLDLRSVLHLM